MINFIVEYKDGVHKVFRKTWCRKEIGTVRDGGITSVRSVVVSNLLDTDIKYEFVNLNPGHEHHSSKGNHFQ